jgi:hypothetical protein
LPLLATGSALAVTTAAYHFTSHAKPPPPAPNADQLQAVPADPDIEALIARRTARSLVTREVITGRVSIPEAAAAFGWLNNQQPHTIVPPLNVLAAHAGLPDPTNYTTAEQLGLQVVAWVVAETEQERSARTAARIRAEFLAARRAGEFARLPTADEGKCLRLLARARAEVARFQGEPAPGCGAVLARR